MKIKIKTIKDIKSFTIDRSKWVRGGKGGEACMLNKQGNMCCLGFYAKACGLTDDQLVSKNLPDDVVYDSFLDKGHLNKAWLANYQQKDTEIVEWKSKLFKIENSPYGFEFDKKIAINTSICEKLADINDDVTLSESEREEKLISSFQKMDVKVKFKF